MAWLAQFLKTLAGEAPKDLIFVQNIKMAGAADEPIQPDECYIELYVESLRLAKARSFATKFHGLVYSFVSLPREGDTNASYAAVSKPEKLATLDPQSLDKVITVSKQMMGAAPWRGGPLNLELGLFSVKPGNLLTPILDYVTRVSSTAGISFVGAIKPFLPLITEGMDLIAGQTGDTRIAVAVDTSLTLTASGFFAIIDASKGQIDVAKLSIDPIDRKLLLNGAPLNEGYCVFSIRRALQKADYGEIPELKDRYAALQQAIKSNRKKDADEALVAFRLATITSPDLIASDAAALVAKAQEKVRQAFPGGGVAKALLLQDEPLEALSDIGLY